MSEGKKAIIRYEAFSGVTFHITPLSFAAARAIERKAENMFPLPDPHPYQKADENAFSDGQLSPAEENPDYLTAKAQVIQKRAEWTDRAIFDYCVSCPEYPTPEALVQAFKPQLDKLREIAVLPEDDYEVVLFYIVLNRSFLQANGRWSGDYIEMVRAAYQNVPLTPAEVAEGVRFFRTQV